MKGENKLIVFQDEFEIMRVSVRFAKDFWLTQNQLPFHESPYLRFLVI